MACRWWEQETKRKRTSRSRKPDKRDAWPADCSSPSDGAMPVEVAGGVAVTVTVHSGGRRV
ncbi:hypothetical protein DMC64_37240 [Amycolatopsis sp. WAC 04197]|nr:hypothetical protein DMC64_37240 [Amycolatopsis sp. WAC 04197]